ncbi:anti-sigma regulatory factor (Ser/Thr protein kinase) [Streptomyces sp. TLI_55]|uniref:ATP-binding protein n=1 Tax=Streptomyces sp. TLI_55 TaxID=1938861 RepID=UPI000BC3E570|nr:ATP-binding protein [Streptomyces sp. TLI_55]SNX66261.1 anti-sigma regulatory factor (Ser/Thr protein kinase) [Streptomyces sp. TLI_55]
MSRSDRTAVVTTAASAREYARAVVREQWDTESRTAREEDVVDLLLVVSELVSNALRHGDGLAAFEATATHDGVRLTVHDHSDELPDVVHGSGALPLPGQGQGYGWPIIMRLARDIRMERLPGGGKAISVLVPLRGRPQPPHQGRKT